MLFWEWKTIFEMIFSFHLLLSSTNQFIYCVSFILTYENGMFRSKKVTMIRATKNIWHSLGENFEVENQLWCSKDWNCRLHKSSSWYMTGRISNNQCQYYYYHHCYYRLNFVLQILIENDNKFHNWPDTNRLNMFYLTGSSTKTCSTFLFFVFFSFIYNSFCIQCIQNIFATTSVQLGRILFFRDWDLIEIDF